MEIDERTDFSVFFTVKQRKKTTCPLWLLWGLSKVVHVNGWVIGTEKVLHECYLLLLAGQNQNILGKCRVDICCFVAIFDQLVSVLPFQVLIFEKLPISECVVSLVEIPRHLSSWAGRESKLDWLEPQAQPLENLILEWHGARREGLRGVLHSHTVRGEPGAMRGQQDRRTAEQDRRRGQLSKDERDLPRASAFVHYCIWQPPRGSSLLSFNLE